MYEYKFVQRSLMMMCVYGEFGPCCQMETGVEFPFKDRRSVFCSTSYCTDNTQAGIKLAVVVVFDSSY